MANDSKPALIARYYSLGEDCMIPLGEQGRETFIYIAHVYMITVIYIYIYMSHSMIAKTLWGLSTDFLCIKIFAMAHISDSC